MNMKLWNNMENVEVNNKSSMMMKFGKKQPNYITESIKMFGNCKENQNCRKQTLNDTKFNILK